MMFDIQDHQVLEIKLYRHASECIKLAVHASANANARGMEVDGESSSNLATARAAEAADIYMLYLLSRNKFTEALRVTKNPQFSAHLSPDVADLAHTNIVSRNLLTRQFTAILSSNSYKAKADSTQSDISIR